MPVPTPASVKKTLDEKRASATIPQVKADGKPRRNKSTTSSVKTSEKRRPKTLSDISTGPTIGSSKNRSTVSKEHTKTSSKSRATSASTDRSPRKKQDKAEKSFERRPLSSRPFSMSESMQALQKQMKESNNE